MYDSVQDIVDTMEKKDILAKLKELGSTTHHATKVEKLAEELFDHYNPDAPIKSIEVNSETVEPEDAYRSKLKSIAAGIRKESAAVKKAKATKVKKYISKNFNFFLPRKGMSSDNKRIRYVDGYDTLDIEKQNQSGEVFKLPNIKFRGVENHIYKMGTYEGRSILSVENPTLQEFIESHRRYGSDFILYDEEEISKKEQIEDRKITKLKSWAYEASFDDLVCVLVYINMKSGKGNYDILAATTDQNRLIKQATDVIEKARDGANLFLEAMESDHAKFVHLVHKAKDKGIVTVSRDGRYVKMAENNNVVCESSLSSDWENDLIDHLFTPEGQPLLKKMEQKCNYYVV